MSIETDKIVAPWEFRSDHKAGSDGIYDAEGRHVASMSLGDRKGRGRLMAAAPDLLQVLEAIDEDIGYGGGGANLSADLLRRVKAAIAKAKGE